MTLYFIGMVEWIGGPCRKNRTRGSMEKLVMGFFRLVQVLIFLSHKREKNIWKGLWFNILRVKWS